VLANPTIFPFMPDLFGPENEYLAALRRLRGRAWAAFLRWRMRRRTYAALSVLSDATLRDIGLHRSEIRSVACWIAEAGRR
jgi:uncharacterized protein YjiS (DUF1127 family)